jgi:hypothetical protein
MESNEQLHEFLRQTFGFERISTDGSTKTKGDAFGHLPGVEQPITISIKNPSGKNTQVHLPTLASWRDVMPMPDIIYDTLCKWLGTTRADEFELWSNAVEVSDRERKYQRLGSYHLTFWTFVLEYLDKVTKSKQLPIWLLQSINGNHPVKYLIWIQKKTKQFEIIDVDAFVNWTAINGRWINSTNKQGHYYNLWCVGPDGKKIFSMQMKGSGGKEGGYDHNPQFHLYPFWPEQFILYRGQL